MRTSLVISGRRLFLVVVLLLFGSTTRALIAPCDPHHRRNIITFQSQARKATKAMPTPAFGRPSKRILSKLRAAQQGEEEEEIPAADMITYTSTTPDYGEIAKYGFSTLLQFSIIAGTLRLLDQVSKKKIAAGVFPSPLVGFLFAFLSLRSRVASVLDNSRPNREAMDGKATPSDVKRPSWTPPGIAFPFIWLTITGLRAVSSALVYTQTKSLACLPLFAMVMHLCIGDTWNTITNIEKRLGVSAVGVLFVWTSVWYAIKQYYLVSPMAGKLLSPSGIWISIATVLCCSIWRINDSPSGSGNLQPLWPVKGDGKSAGFKWSNMGQLEATTIRGGK